MAVLLLGRLVLSTAFRVIYPLLTFVATSLNVDLQAASLVITIQVAVQVASPLGGTLADLRGERETMLWGLAIFCIGATLCALADTLALFLVGYALIGSGTALYQPACYAYASARSSYQRRGRVLGILEIGWALAALLGVTLLTRLTDLTSALAPVFWALLGAGVLTLVATLLLPRTRKPGGQRGPVVRPSLSVGMFTQPVVIATLVFTFCVMMAYELIVVPYAGWLEQDFSANVQLIGLVFGSLGFVELAGSALSASFTDRIGKKRAVVVGFSAMALCMALLPLTGGNWLVFLPVFWLMGLCSEFSIVSNFPLISSVVPAARGTMLALALMAFALSRVIGSLISVPLWETAGFLANGLLAAGVALTGVLICVLFVHEGET
jgi:predicted MFS family arabinose efflux permease